MAIGPGADSATNDRVYTKRQGGIINNANVGTELLIDVNGLLNVWGEWALNNVPLPSKIGFTIAPGAANHTVITIQVLDNAGNTITGYPFRFDVSLSDAANGVGLTATTASGGIAVTTGTQVVAYVASKALRVETDATGKAVINITDTAKTSFYVAVVGPGPIPAVSRQLVTGDYA